MELAFSRYGIAERALLRLAEARPKVYEVEKHIEGELVRVRTLAGGKHARSIEFRRGDAWQRVRTDELAEVDVLLLHLEFTTAALTPLRRTLGLLHKGCRFVTYQDLTTFFRKADPPFQQIDRNLEDDVRDRGRARKEEAAHRFVGAPPPPSSRPTPMRKSGSTALTFFA